MPERAKKAFRLLIVEDNRLFRKVLRVGMERRFPDAGLWEAQGVGEGYRLALESRADVVFLDIGLPDGSGLELAKRLRAELPQVGLAVCTMNDLPEYREAARRCGVGLFVGKDRMDWRAIECFVRETAGRGLETRAESAGKPRRAVNAGKDGAPPSGGSAGDAGGRE